MNPRTLLLAFLACAATLPAQTFRVSCPEIFKNSSQAISCVESLFSESGYHFTLASLPTSNGFGPGIVFTHAFKGTTNGQELDLSATGAVTTNGSWFTGGDATWTFSNGSNNLSTDERNLASAAAKDWHNPKFHLNASHRSVRTLYFYGTGSRSSATRYTYAEDDTWGKFDARVPIAHDIILTGESQLESSTLPPPNDLTSIFANVPSQFTPGIMQQPLYLNNSIGIDTRIVRQFATTFRPLSVGAPHFQPRIRMELNNKASLRFQHPTDGSAFEFRQFRFDGDEHFDLRGILRNGFDQAAYPYTYRFRCQGKGPGQGQDRQRDLCHFMMFDIESHLVLSDTSGANQIPFYLQPTLGGNDIDANVTLRGWDDYRFRDRDAALIQAEADYIVYDPFGVYVFYDGGTVAANAGGLALSNFRNDAGIGIFARIQGSIIAQTYYAWGRGNGGRWSYNFAKVF
ncbi:MAG: hypothetical protein BGO25_08450 [Acidobacteriales bacterium 59-55]|nr:hypothetical protein [Terriglobales bacterium]OJV43367.1 MAG: hypothetical protein BGO25_08450 [Acidobacteriales bacterium 59-55]